MALLDLAPRRAGKLFALAALALPLAAGAVDAARPIDLTPARPGAARAELLPAGSQAAPPAAGLGPQLAPTPGAGLDGGLAQSTGSDALWDDRFVVPGRPFETLGEIAQAADGTVYALDTGGQDVYRWTGRHWDTIGKVPFGANDIAVLGSNLYLIGSFDQVSGAAINDFARWDGTEWSQVGTGIGPIISASFGDSEGTLYTIEAVGNALYVGGRFTKIDDVPLNSIARWENDSWSALAEGIRRPGFEEGTFRDGVVYDIAADGATLYVGGEFELAGSASASSVAAWNGSGWAGLGSGLSFVESGVSAPARISALAAGGGKLYVGGEVNRAGGKVVSAVAAWDGSAWAPMGTGITSQFRAEIKTIFIDGAGVLVGGDFDAAGGKQTQGFARWENGAWSAVVPSLSKFGSGGVYEVIAAAGGGLYVAGNFDVVTGKTLHNIARINAAGWHALGQGITATDTGGFPGRIDAMVTDAEGRIYIGGRFATAGGVPALNIAMWDGTGWSALGAGVSGDVRALELVGDSLFVGGTFTTAGGVAAQHIAEWNITTRTWSALGNGVNGEVYALDFSDGELFVGGSFDSAGGTQAYDVAVWDGAKWAALSSKLRIYEVFDSCAQAGTQVYSIAVQGDLVYIGGHFRLVLVNPNAICSPSSYLPANNIVIWNRATDEWFLMGTSAGFGVTGGSGLFASVNDIAPLGDEVYVGGRFDKAGIVAASSIARFTSAGWSAVGAGVSGQNVGSTLSGVEVKALETAGGQLYLGGVFSAAGTSAAHFVARYDTDADAWHALGSGPRGASGATRSVDVSALALTQDSVYIGGSFESAGGKDAAAFARYGEVVRTGGPVTGPTTTPTTGPGPDQPNKIYVPMFRK